MELSTSSSAVTCGITSLRSALSNKQSLSPAANVAIDAFLAKTQRLHRRDGRSGPSGFEREYMEICWSIDKAPDYEAMLTPQTKATKTKNRYRDVLPFEKTRVKLQTAASKTEDDYINANYIDGGYIACCAPVPAAIRDFWHMRERLKADMYWDPKGHTVDFDGVNVKLLEEESPERLGFIVRKFKVWKGESESRVIQHIQLTTWPDHGVLRDFQVIAPMLDAVNSYRNEASRQFQVEARVVVHCSAGIGRSGTFIAIDILLKQLHQVLNDKSSDEAQAIQALDISRVVYHLRSQRPGMVQTPDQYEMIYQYLAAVVSDKQPW
ncbi:Receptor-type tyrosine-protein phosphatase [Phytophthora palmivora]|uniref:Receptor-type tyrosine-protein phosphatase n=1 Tax=Phytophthora palmivora TaxID=4796 RepID=A0A2P4X3L2_9STRA|nr:Receptor-type tyrosine-protein phosphatase [Phytophthora palmivora]